LGAIFARIFREFVQIFSYFAEIFANFARIFDKSKLWRCACIPCTIASYTTGCTELFGLQSLIQEVSHEIYDQTIFDQGQPKGQHLHWKLNPAERYRYSHCNKTRPKSNQQGALIKTFP